jgi:uridine kinase
VGIDGVDAAGKTTLADALAAALRERGREVVRAGVDRFHRPRAARMQRGQDSPEGYYHDSFDFPALVAALLAPLGLGGDREYRVAVFDLETDAAVDGPTRRAGPRAVLVFDGIFLHRPELRSHWDLSIFLEVGFDVTVARAERRDAALLGGREATRRRYATRYVPGQRLYLSECDPAKLATAVIDNRDFDAPRLRWRDSREGWAAPNGGVR